MRQRVRADAESKMAQRPAVNRTNPTEVYGFVLWMSTFVAFLAFLLWAFLPEHILESVGVTYFPSKWWAIAIPAYLTVVLVFIVVIYAAFNLYSTNPLDSFSTIT